MTSTGFSVRSDVRHKPAKHDPIYKTFHRDWAWVEGDAKRLCKAVTQGVAVTPGHWRDGTNRYGSKVSGYKSKYRGDFKEAHFVMLDFDGGLKLKDAIEHPFFSKTASFLYTSPSHRLPGKGDRLRVVWQLSTPVHSWKDLDDVILSLRLMLGGIDDSAINAASLLFGSQPDKNENFFCHVWANHKNRLDPTPLIQERQRAREKRRAELIAHGFQNGDSWELDKDTCGEDRVSLMIHCLKFHESFGGRYVPERIEDTGSYDIVFKVLGGLIHYFGVELTYHIIEQAEWWGDESFDIDSLIDELILREENFDPDLNEKWSSYGTVLKYAGEHLVSIDSNGAKGHTWVCPVMPKEDFLKFKYQSASADAEPPEVNDEEAETYNNQVDEVIRLELSDDYQDNQKATLLKAKVAKQYGVSPQSLHKDVQKGALASRGIDLHGRRSVIKVDTSNHGWDFSSDEDEDAMEYLISGVLPRKGTTAIAGVGGSGKNKYAAYLAYRAKMGLPCLPHVEMPVAPFKGKILFIATDQPNNAKQRVAQDFRDAGATNQWLMDNVIIIAADPKQGQAAWTATTKGLCKLKEFMDTGEIGLVIIDSLKAITAGTDFHMSDNNDMSLLTRALMLIVNEHAPMIIINHAAEPTKKLPTINEMQTATAFGQMVDAVFIIRKPMEEGVYNRELYGVKIRDNNEGVKVTYTIDPDTEDLKLEQNHLSPEADKIDVILEAIDKNKIKGRHAPLGAKRIAEATKTDVRNVSNYLVKLNQLRLVRKKGKGYLVTAKGLRHLEALRSKTFKLDVQKLNFNTDF